MEDGARSRHRPPLLAVANNTQHNNAQNNEARSKGGMAHSHVLNTTTTTTPELWLERYCKETSQWRPVDVPEGSGVMWTSDDAGYLLLFYKGAGRGVAHRLACRLGGEVGGEVGYSYVFGVESKTPKSTSKKDEARPWAPAPESSAFTIQLDACEGTIKGTGVRAVRNGDRFYFFMRSGRDAKSHPRVSHLAHVPSRCAAH